MLRFLHASEIPGKELEDTAHLKKRCTSLPTEIADVLINKEELKRFTEGSVY